MSVAVFAVLMPMIVALPAIAADIETTYYEATWARTDRPVASGDAQRTWMWGPAGFSNAFVERYENAPSGVRLVQYFDKSRMEITHPEGDTSSQWYVTNGLLVLELVSGRMQLGDNSFEQHPPAQVNVAGDADDANGPTYASFTNVLGRDSGAENAVVTRGIRRDGGVFDNTAWTSYGVSESVYVPETRHWIAEPFWDFMTSAGTVYKGGHYVSDSLFENAFYATGFPVTDAYWASVKVGGNPRNVLIQCFERRCLTYTPDNPPGWQVEAGNVGQHYFRWRYGANTPPHAWTDSLEITAIQPSPDPISQSVTVRNSDASAVNLTGWTLWDRHSQHGYVFPNVVLHPGATVTVHNCNGTNTGIDLFAGFCQSWWDGDDYALLINESGNLVDFYERDGG